MYNLDSNKLIVSRKSTYLDQDKVQEKTTSDDNDNAIGIKGMRHFVNIFKRHNVVISDLVTFNEASQHEIWRNTMEIEISMINKNLTWKLVDKLDGKKKNTIGVRWNFKIKYNTNGSVNKHKIRLVVK